MPEEDIMPLAEPKVVRNTQSGPLVFSATGDSNDYFEFQGSGDPDGGDYQIIPGELFSNVRFRRNLTLGLLVEVEDQAAIDQSMAGQRAEWEFEQAQRQKDAKASLDQVSENDILQKECLGPPTRAGVAMCGVPVPVRADAERVAPPLCQAHKHKAGEFRLRETGRVVGNKNEVVWEKAAPSE